MRIFLSVLLCAGLSYCRPQSSYLAPGGAASESFYLSPDFSADFRRPPAPAPAFEPSIPEALASEAIGSGYGSPVDNVISSASEAIGSGYGSPVDNVISSASEAIGSGYGSPVDNVISSASEAIASGYGSPRTDVISAASESVGSTYGSPADNVISSASEAAASSYGSNADNINTLFGPESAASEAIASSYGSPADNVLSAASEAVASSYGSPVDNVLSAASEAVASNYGSPADNAISSASEAIASSYGSPADNVIALASEAIASSYGSPADNVIALASEPVVTTRQIIKTRQPARRIKAVRRPQVKIIRSEYNTPDSKGDWNYSYESENGITQETRGELRSIGEALVNVMSGSYSYVGPDGLTYQVDWYADETGFHPSAPHLPRSVEIPFPEQVAAVAAQLEFAAQQERTANAGQQQRSAAASNLNSVTVDLDEYDDLSGYDLRAYSL